EESADLHLAHLVRARPAAARRAARHGDASEARRVRRGAAELDARCGATRVPLVQDLHAHPDPWAGGEGADQVGRWSPAWACALLARAAAVPAARPGPRHAAGNASGAMICRGGCRPMLTWRARGSTRRNEQLDLDGRKVV